jgi:hypothetical protein
VSCVEEHCPNELQSCREDKTCIPAMESCLLKCQADQNCWTFCLPGKGSTAAINLFKCGIQYDCLNN